jgi:hypothetical protein
MVYFREDPPWKTKMDPMAGRDDMQKQTDHAEAIRDREMKVGGRWKKWEEGRKKALKERRDYFRKHPEKKDDMSGV